MKYKEYIPIVAVIIGSMILLAGCLDELSLFDKVQNAMKGIDAELIIDDDLGDFETIKKGRSVSDKNKDVIDVYRVYYNQDDKYTNFYIACVGNPNSKHEDTYLALLLKHEEVIDTNEDGLDQEDIDDVDYAIFYDYNSGEAFFQDYIIDTTVEDAVKVVEFSSNILLLKLKDGNLRESGNYDMVAVGFVYEDEEQKSGGAGAAIVGGIIAAIFSFSFLVAIAFLIIALMIFLSK
jgi:hypothetical protein